MGKKIVKKGKTEKVQNNIKRKVTKIVSKGKNKSFATIQKNIDKKIEVKENKTEINPLNSWILIRPFIKEDLASRNSFGLILPENNKKEKSERGEVLAVGNGVYKEGKRIPLVVKVGDIVVFSRYGYEDITVDDEELYLVKEENILAILN